MRYIAKNSVVFIYIYKKNKIRICIQKIINRPNFLATLFYPSRFIICTRKSTLAEFTVLCYGVTTKAKARGEKKKSLRGNDRPENEKYSKIQYTHASQRAFRPSCKRKENRKKKKRTHDLNATRVVNMLFIRYYTTEWTKATLSVCVPIIFYSSCSIRWVLLIVFYSNHVKRSRLNFKICL